MPKPTEMIKFYDNIVITTGRVAETKQWVLLVEVGEKGKEPEFWFPLETEQAESMLSGLKQKIEETKKRNEDFGT